MGGPGSSGSVGARPAPRSSTLDTLLTAAASMAATVYRQTAQDVKAIGIGVGPELFTRCVLIARERFGLPESAAEIEARGWIDVVHPDGFKLRIAVSDEG